MINDFKSIENLPLIKQVADSGDKLSPNSISVVGFASAIVAAILALNHLYAMASLMTAIHLLCDGLDGYIARRYNKTSKKGFLLDHIFDRLSDLILFPSIGYSLDLLLPGIIVSIICLFSSYVGVLNTTLGEHQDKSGIFAKTYRYQLLIFILFTFSLNEHIRSSLYEHFCYGSIFIGGITIIERLKTLFAKTV